MQEDNEHKSQNGAPHPEPERDDTLSDSPRQTTPLPKEDDATPLDAFGRDDKKRATAILPGESKFLKRAMSSQQQGNTASLDGKQEVILVIRGLIERLLMEDGVEYHLGRFDPHLRKKQEIDLSPYGAEDKGVSRHHATLHRDGDYLYITDLDSRNGTFVGGQKLQPNVPTILKRGAELLLGRLSVQVLFR
jgi:hypothetical protein